MAPRMARVCFLRPARSLNGNVWAAAPMVYANGATVGDIPDGTDFFHDFPPGTYRFTVQSYGLPAGQAETLQLAPGTQTYLEVQWVASWQEGYPDAQYLRYSDDVAAAGTGISTNTGLSPTVMTAHLNR